MLLSSLSLFSVFSKPWVTVQYVFHCGFSFLQSLSRSSLFLIVLHFIKMDLVCPPYLATLQLILPHEQGYFLPYSRVRHKSNSSRKRKTACYSSVIQATHLLATFHIDDTVFLIKFKTVNSSCDLDQVYLADLLKQYHPSQAVHSAEAGLLLGLIFLNCLNDLQ